MNERIRKFIKKQTCATVCCADESGKPYCFTVFYAFDFDKALLFYKSSKDARHSLLLKDKPDVAGTILPDKLSLLAIKGIQFEGSVLVASDSVNKTAASIYYAKHPIARATTGEIWAIRVNYIKFTDNSLGFGRKLLWSREKLSLIGK